MSVNNWLLGYIFSKFLLDLKPIGHIPKIHLLKMSFNLLLAERLDQQIRYVMYGVNSLHLDKFFLKVFTYDVKPSLYMLRLMVRSGLLSKGYGTVIIIVQYNGI